MPATSRAYSPYSRAPAVRFGIARCADIRHAAAAPAIPAGARRIGAEQCFPHEADDRDVVEIITHPGVLPVFMDNLRRSAAGSPIIVSGS